MIIIIKEVGSWLSYKEKDRGDVVIGDLCLLVCQWSIYMIYSAELSIFITSEECMCDNLNSV